MKVSEQNKGILSYITISNLQRKCRANFLKLVKKLVVDVL